MTNICDNCFHCIGYENEDTVICDRIWVCYVKVKEECKYFKLIDGVLKGDVE